MLRELGRAMAVCAMALLSACAYSSHDLRLRPTAETRASDVGQGTRVFFRFVDEREDVTIGHRGAEGYSSTAKVSAADWPQVVESQLRDALQKKQFQLVGGEMGADASVTYRLLSFKFDNVQGAFTMSRRTTATLAVDAQRGSQSYGQVYRYNNESGGSLAVPFAGEIDARMNDALNQILTKADNDATLDHVLAGK